MLGLTTPDSVSVNAVKQKGKSKNFTDCKFCGCSHDKGECQAYGKTCNHCGRKNHFESKCHKNSSKSKGKGTLGRSQKCDKCGHSGKQVDLVECNQDSDEFAELIDQVQSLYYH